MTDQRQRANALVARGNEFHDSGQYEPAIALYREGMALVPGDSTYASFNLVVGDMLVSLGRFDDAADAYRALVTAIPDQDQGWEGLARCLEMQGRHGEAAQTRAEALAASGVPGQRLEAAREQARMEQLPGASQTSDPGALPRSSRWRRAVRAAAKPILAYVRFSRRFELEIPNRGHQVAIGGLMAVGFMILLLGVGLLLVNAAGLGLDYDRYAAEGVAVEATAVRTRERWVGRTRETCATFFFFDRTGTREGLMSPEICGVDVEEDDVLELVYFPEDPEDTAVPATRLKNRYSAPLSMSIFGAIFFVPGFIAWRLVRRPVSGPAL